MNATADTERLLTPQQVHQRTGLALQTLANWRHRGKGPRWIKTAGSRGRTGGRVRYPLSAVEEYMASRTVTTSDAPQPGAA